jgi:hypothetical protein
MYNYSKINPDQLEYVTVGSTEDLMEGERLFVEIDGTPIVIFRIARIYVRTTMVLWGMES